ncbi:MAG: N-6 DNA methylase, partial [Desulfovibrio sp.]|nr:N-6 DNA methylase [Desulfovibrio sp.]
IANAIKFSAKWREARKEEADAQPFTLDFIKVFGVADPLAVGEFEAKVNLDDGHSGYIDYLWPKRIAIEMKSPGKDLKKAYEQLKNYMVHLPPEKTPELLMVSDFVNIRLYHPVSGKTASFKLKDLRAHIREFATLAGYEISRVPEEQLEVNVKAAEKIAVLHDFLLESGYSGHNLQLYLARILFCLFAEDTGVFPKNSFLDYVFYSREDGSDLADRLERLFEILNTSPEERQKRTRLAATLLQFQYINGKLFAELLPRADFDAKMRAALIECAQFDWSKISPAIFGSIFQGVMDKKKRRELGAHYTSEENILKLVNALFMDDLWAEFHGIKASPGKLKEFHKKIASLNFLDPACGCGNFLIIAYRELRRLELAILKMLMETGRGQLTLESFLKVGVRQFYGIELEGFPARIAQVGMWLMDHQMNMEAAEAFGGYYARLPLKESATIKNDNALETDWEDVVSGGELDYIIGNPPFAGARVMSEAQKKELLKVFEGAKNAGELDYVCCWFAKANELMKKHPNTKTAFVATNSITQGVQPALLWKPVIDSGSFINFGYRTFKWQSEASGKAAVHCVIVGFDRHDNPKKFIYEGDQKTAAKNINGYLVDAENIYIESRKVPLWDAPKIGMGNQPIDGGYYLFDENAKNEFLKKEPDAKKYFRKWIGSYEFINRVYRYCLWLGETAPAELKGMPECLKIVEKVTKYRLGSKSGTTRRLASKPTRFNRENLPRSSYLVIPEVSSEKRKYIPIGFISPDIMPSNLVKVVEDANLYHFGILTSILHNAWMRQTGGRLKSDYRYSQDIVYNNFPWPEVDDKEKAKIEELSREILAVREKYQESGLADLYDPLTMPPDLLKAHEKLDKAVLRLYGLPASAGEREIV